MLVDWIAHAQREYDDGSEDPMRTMLKATIDEAYEMNEAWNRHQGGRPLARAINELTGLMNQPDKTRGSVMSTVDSALNPFKKLAVRQRMERSSFSFADLRGMPKKEAREREQAKLLAARERGEHYQPS